jgi:hypothetical protein
MDGRLKLAGVLEWGEVIVFVPAGSGTEAFRLSRAVFRDKQKNQSLRSGSVVICGISDKGERE